MVAQVGVLPFQVTPLTNQCVPLLSHTHYLYSGHVRYRLYGYRWTRAPLNRKALEQIGTRFYRAEDCCWIN